ncbi:hypothetical protein [Stigmatella aurantiaca]|uniref:Conserved uncharacterized protein n=1 Tax=Stigmatella aurantiaca (strain DW4/3-1) TaxID=378806 RepID=Q09CH6_STIAD|nr:hypothetical protein [Stigmatella aurantiaca]ADO69627.1 conserved uncharacterized protein [Stigmatella aurantiaca DW4/3-1]EAU69410.1 conserved hypothetical protein [Stigmatella aurantiaca DW4/3-1]
MPRLFAPSQRWLFGRETDLAVFAGTALVSVALVAMAPWLGVVGDTPPWAWVLLVVCVDVAHVWSTVFRTYLDGEELLRRPALYAIAPLAAYVTGVLAYLVSAGLFWRLFAYTALFHFVRQQYGWVALYARKARTSDAERRLDAAAIYAATLGPVVWWHANLPREFWWFVENDFLSGLPGWVGTLALWVHGGVLAVWAGFQVTRVFRGEGLQVGKVLLVLATWVTWLGGIVLARDDFAFTVMNVLLHGVPYFALLFRYARGRNAEGGYGAWAPLLRAGLPGFLLFLTALAFAEEFLWDRLVWHDRPLLFGDSGFVLAPDVLALVVPLLALPQATHYLLDAFIWKAGKDPALLGRLGWRAPVREGSPLGTLPPSPVAMARPTD